MADRYVKWYQAQNPLLGVLTNTLVNSNAGIRIYQTQNSPIHVMPAGSLIGKVFSVANEIISTQNVLVNVNTEAGLTLVTINPGDSAGFRWLGNNIWDLDSGETIITNFGGTSAPGQSFLQLTDVPHSYSGAAGQVLLVNPTENGVIFGTVQGGIGQLTRTIVYTDAPDAPAADYVVGTLPLGSKVLEVNIIVDTPFNNTGLGTSSMAVIAQNGLNTLAPNSDNDLRTIGTYITELPATDTSDGTVIARLNTAPNVGGSTQGQVIVVVQYTN